MIKGNYVVLSVRKIVEPIVYITEGQDNNATSKLQPAYDWRLESSRNYNDVTRDFTFYIKISPLSIRRGNSPEAVMPVAEIMKERSG